MKTLFFFLLTSIVALWACNTLAKDEVKEFIPGTYVRSAQHEFGTEHDTVTVTLQNPAANEYKIVRRWKYERILDGKPVEPEYKQTTNSAIYIADSKLLQEQETLENYSFEPKQKAMFAGSTKYQKLK